MILITALPDHTISSTTRGVPVSSDIASAPSPRPVTLVPGLDLMKESKAGTRVTGLGDGAEAISELTGTPRVVLLIVWSGNAVIKIIYTSYASLSGPPLPAPAAQLAATVAMARDILATLTRA